MNRQQNREAFKGTGIPELIDQFRATFGEKNVKVKAVENFRTGYKVGSFDNPRAAEAV